MTEDGPMANGLFNYSFLTAEGLPADGMAWHGMSWKKQRSPPAQEQRTKNKEQRTKNKTPNRQNDN
jgi:hypothetical protein